jgi:hypothetical protein
VGITPAIILWLAASALTASTLLLGQFGVLAALPVAAAWRAMRRGHWRSAGAWLGFICALKLFLIPLVVWCTLDRSRWRAVVWATIAGIATIGLSIAIFGWEMHAAWMANLADVTWPWGINNASFHGWLGRSFQKSAYFVPLLDIGPTAVSWIALLGGGVVLAITLWIVRAADIDQAVSAVLLASLWASPLGWIYYGWIAVPSTLALWRAGRLSTRWVSAGAICALMSPLYLRDVAAPWWSLTVASAYFWSVTCFLVAALTAVPCEHSSDTR